MKLTQLTLVILLSLFTFLAFAEETPPISQQALLTLMATPANKPLVLDAVSYTHLTLPTSDLV